MYIHALTIYAFCNTHDVTRDTEGHGNKSDAIVEVDVPWADGGLNMMYVAELKKFSTEPPRKIHVVSEAEKQDYYYRKIRSIVVLLWIFCNFALVKLMLYAVGIDHIDVENSSGTQRSAIYMTVVLWSVAGSSLFRFVGAMWYWLFQ